jgi:hypothetical protein
MADGAPVEDEIEEAGTWAASTVTAPFVKRGWQADSLAAVLFAVPIVR